MKDMQNSHRLKDSRSQSYFDGQVDPVKDVQPIVASDKYVYDTAAIRVYDIMCERFGWKTSRGYMIFPSDYAELRNLFKSIVRQEKDWQAERNYIKRFKRMK